MDVSTIGNVLGYVVEGRIKSEGAPGEEKRRRLQEEQNPQSDVYIGQLSSRKAESQNIHSSCVALAKAACIRARRDDEAASAASSVAAIMARTALWNSS